MIEEVGHDVTEDGKFPAQPKCDVINDWRLPTNGKSLFSFIGLVHFYHSCAPYFEIRMNPLRKFLKLCYRKPIPLMDWTPALIESFKKLKIVTISPVLARFDPNKPTFLKTDWSAEGMLWIIIQPAYDEES